MREILLCKSADNEGKILFTVYDSDKKAVSNYTNDEMMQKIVRKEIENAKLENSVVKITDSKKALAKLSFEESGRSSVFYIISEYESPLGSKMYGAVSNTGEIFEFSASLAEEFAAERKIVNGYVNKSGLHVINVPVFSTALHKSLEHTRVH